MAHRIIQRVVAGCSFVLILVLGVARDGGAVTIALANAETGVAAVAAIPATPMI